MGRKDDVSGLIGIVKTNYSMTYVKIDAIEEASSVIEDEHARDAMIMVADVLACINAIQMKIAQAMERMIEEGEG